ncbi:DUF4235 domain-containing protein [Arthrobacter sp. MMS18-M83]|uniref:DUF4235 domain-containing protein n=1 Tax=Arthrobacter sp. MMS18-M83 TaxID=2996261 RepID=UPI00227CBBE6|nr:DUF4235 domain-containing protein [Arthrobacter sp. MMS18-M83]WAH96627.1 DUF4235 domain-containing protein [Arthrobacter sp. MMS18-M83]
MEAVWSKSTGKHAPKDATNLEDSLPGVALFAVAGAAVVSVIHVMTQRATKEGSRQSAGDSKRSLRPAACPWSCHCRRPHGGDHHRSIGRLFPPVTLTSGIGLYGDRL